MPAHIKIECELSDLLRVIKAQTMLTKVVIESGEDIDGAVNTLLSHFYCRYAQTKPGFSALNGSQVVIHLFGKSDEFSEKEGQMAADRLFAKDAQKLQSHLNYRY